MFYAHKQERDDIEFNFHYKGLSKPHIDHFKPSNYGLTQDEAEKIHLRYLKGRKKSLQTNVDMFYRLHLQSPSWFTTGEWKEWNDKLERVKSTIYFIKHKDKYTNLPKFDIERLKQIPIGEIVEVQNNNFFKIRDEKTPSCYWYKSSNRWCDFGSSESGDVIDITMKLNNIDFISACQLLTNKIGML